MRFVDEPHGPLHGAKNAVGGRKENSERVIPGLEERTVKGRVVGHELGHAITATFPREHADGRMAA